MVEADNEAGQKSGNPSIDLWQLAENAAKE